ncbi:RNA-binding domain superfamily [Sesbania bispinosa]|nr:RNA-binding domain superfamily [Sesbania bispinosa]
MTPVNLAGQFGDTTYTKVFVGGLAWETQKETMKKYFEQFEAAMRACVDAAPVIDGRRANCNLASLGVQRSKPSTPKHGFGGVGSAFPSATTFPHYAIQQGIPYNVYGYSSYSPDYTYPTSYYSVYGGATAQYPVYGSGPAGGMMTGAAAAAAFYPYLQYAEGSGGGTTGGYTSGQGYGVNYPPQLFQYSPTGGYAQHYGTPISLAPSPALQSGVTMAVQAPIPHR